MKGEKILLQISSKKTWNPLITNETKTKHKTTENV